MKRVAILTAAGIGTRMGLDIPKQFLHVHGKPLIVYTMEAFQRHPAIDGIVVVTLPSWIDVIKSYADGYNITKLKLIVPGGDSGQESIYNGIKALEENGESEDTVVLIHDGNRCLVTEEIISNSLAVYDKYGSAVAAIPCTEVVFRSGDSGEHSNEEIPREQLYRTQTPHTYSLKKLLWAHAEAKSKGISNTSASCSLMYKLGETIYFSKGSEENIKITTTDDLNIFKALLDNRSKGSRND